MESGIAKVMAKMGISTLQSYKGAQIFEAVGLDQEIVDKCFKGTSSRLGGVTFQLLAQEARLRHEMAYQERECDSYILREPGTYHWRYGGEKHINDPLSIGNLQVFKAGWQPIDDNNLCMNCVKKEAAKNNSSDAFARFQESTLFSLRQCTLRGQLELTRVNNPISVEDVEPASEIVKRFVTGNSLST